MGCELHVRRAVSGDEAEDMIEEEWLQFVADATDFEFQNEVSTTSLSGERVEQLVEASRRNVLQRNDQPEQTLRPLVAAHS